MTPSQKSEICTENKFRNSLWAGLLVSLLIMASDLLAATLDVNGFSPNINNTVYDLAIQTDGKILVAGNFNSVNNTSRNGVARLNAAGDTDQSFDIGSGANSFVFTVLPLPDGKIMIGGSFTSVDGISRSRIARLNADGSVDLNFDPGIGASDGTVFAMSRQANGKLLVAGSFTGFAGTTQRHIVRLNADGSLDASFNPSINSDIFALALQPDGKIVLGGRFTGVNGTGANQIARLNPDGSLDRSFIIGLGANAAILSMALRVDGSLLVAGNFTLFSGVTRNRIALINSDGSVELSFAAAADNTVRTIRQQADGGILIGGAFSQINGFGRNRIARLKPNGDLDTNFNIGSGANADVYAVGQQFDGKLLIGGNFSRVNGEDRSHIARLNSQGRLEIDFDIGEGVDGDATVVFEQLDGKLLVGGEFTTFDGASRNRLARLNVNGTVDTSFNTGSGFDQSVIALASQSDGKILVGGIFSVFNGVNRNLIARLNTDGSLDASFTPQLQFNGGDVSFINAIQVQSDGKILIAGRFDRVNGQVRTHIARLHQDGSLDADFKPTIALLDSDPRINQISFQRDGKILLVGTFSTVSNVARNNIVRLHSDGRLDTSFNPGSGTDQQIRMAAHQKDGKILIVGQFATFNSQSANKIARLNPNGELDTSFNANVSVDPFGVLFFVWAESGGEIVVGGEFSHFNNDTRFKRLVKLTPDGHLTEHFVDVQPLSTFFNFFPTSHGKHYIASQSQAAVLRLASNNAALQTLEINTTGRDIIWQHSGSSPIPARTRFEVSTSLDGAWQALGDGSWSGASWRIRGLDLPRESIFYVRASGYHNSGARSESIRQFFLPPEAENGDDSICFPVKTKNGGIVLVCL